MFSSKDHEPAFTPFEKAEKVYQELVEWYGESDEKALSKIFVVRSSEAQNSYI